MSDLPPAGWHQDPDDPNQYRYWNGHEWTDDFAPMTASQPVGPSISDSPPANKTSGLKIAGLVGAGVLGLAAIGAVVGSDTESPDETSRQASMTAQPATPSEPEPTEATQAAAQPTKSAEPKAKPKPKPYKKLSDRQWKQIVKSPDRFAGDRVIVYANVTQFDAATGDDTFRANAANRNLVEYGFWSGYDNAIFSGTAKQLRKVVQDDVLWMKAIVYGSFRYDTQIGGETTVPAFLVTKVKVVGSTD